MPKCIYYQTVTLEVEYASRASHDLMHNFQVLLYEPLNSVFGSVLLLLQIPNIRRPTYLAQSSSDLPRHQRKSSDRGQFVQGIHYIVRHSKKCIYYLLSDNQSTRYKHWVVLSSKGSKIYQELQLALSVRWQDRSHTESGLLPTE